MNVLALLIPALLACAPAASPAPAAAPAAGPAPAAAPAASPAPAAEVRNVDVAGLQAALAAPTAPLLIDVRTPEEFAGGHVPGARNIPIDQLDGRLAELGAPENDVYVICQSGGRSARASASLAAQGRHPINVTGGTAAWKAAGYPVQ